MRWQRLTVTLFVAILASSSLIAAEVAPASQAPDDEANKAIMAKLAADINGDGIADNLVIDRKGDDHLDAVSGANSEVLWTSACTIPGLGMTNELGLVFSPALHDINEDGLDDIIFSSAGCKAIVALDHKTGSVLWQLLWKDALGSSKFGVGSRPGLNWWERDLRLEGDQLLLAVRQPSSTFMSGVDGSEALVALDPHTGGLLWKSPMPLKLGSDERAGFDASRSEAEGVMTLELRPGHNVVRGEVPPVMVPVGAGAAVGVGFAVTRAVNLQGIADTARFLVADGRAISTSLKNVGSVSLKDGRRLWTWTYPDDVKIFNPVLLSQGGRIFVFGWQGKALHSDDAFVAAIDAATGRELWWRLLPYQFATGNITQPVACTMRLTAGETFTIDYQSPMHRVPSRQVVLESATGKTIKNRAL